VKNSKSGVILLWGDDPFLLREAALEALDGAPAAEVEASAWEGGETADLSTPSLFGERRALLLTDCRSLPKHALAELGAYISAPAPDALLIMTALVPERGKPPAALVKLVQETGEIRDTSVARKDFGQWTAGRAKAKGIALSPAAAKALIATIGEDAAGIDQSLDQLSAAFSGTSITPELVASQFRGLGDQRVWDLCDRAFAKNLADSVRSLRSLLAQRDDPLMILGGIASRVRDLLRVKAVPEHASPTQLAKEAGLRFEWQGRRYREQAGRFTMAELVGIHDQIVEADRDLKSGASGDVVLTQLVTAVAGE
jgi:DNA polymerase-3 subunit delta